MKIKERIRNFVQPQIDYTRLTEAVADTVVNSSVLNNKLEAVKNEINEHTRTALIPEMVTDTELAFALKPTTKKKVLIVGFYGAPNLGDELMLETILQHLAPYHNVGATVMIADNPEFDYCSYYPGVNIIHNPKNSLDYNTLAQYFDAVVFGGGAMIDDSTFNFEYAFRGSTPPQIVYLSERFLAWGKEVYAVGLSSVQKLKNQEYIKRLANLVEKVDHFSVRDEKSLDTLKRDLGVPDGSVSVIHDLVFANQQLRPPQQGKIQRKPRHIGVAWVTGEPNAENTLRTLLDSLDDRYAIHLIPFYTYQGIDIRRYEEAIKKVRDPKRVVLEPAPKNMSEAVAAFSQCDFIISLRYHSALLANILGIPNLMFLYSQHPHYENKMTFLADIFGHNNLYALDPQNLKNITRLVEKTAASFENDLALIQKITKEAQAQVKKCTKSIAKSR